MKKITIGLTLLLFVLVGCATQTTIEYDADVAVPLSLVQDLQFSNTDNLSIEECVQQFNNIAEPLTVTENDVIPSDFVLYIDLDQVYTGWQEFSMEALCVKSNWGVFRTTGIVEVPVEAHVWSINQDA